MLGTHRREWAGRLYCAARKYHGVLLKPGEASPLDVLSPSSRRLAMASLSNLSKYLGVYKAWKDTVDNAGLRWLDGNSEDVVIDRFTRVRNPDEILKWVYTVKERVPSLSTFIDFAAFTGVRFVEAVNSYNLIIKLNQRLI